MMFYVILVLGDNDSGKTTLVAKLQGTEEPKKGCGLEYFYLDVKDEYRDGEYSFLTRFYLGGGGGGGMSFKVAYRVISCLRFFFILLLFYH